MGKCEFSAQNWSCEGTGYLWLAGQERPPRQDYPCPNCNTVVFLQTALRRSTRKYGFAGCPCCKGTSPDGVFPEAMKVARGLQPEIAECFHRNIRDGGFRADEPGPRVRMDMVAQGAE
jgi:ssDNA-binding Zn-finger/Zn-ribbon topoisomerase 1